MPEKTPINVRNAIDFIPPLPKNLRGVRESLQNMTEAATHINGQAQFCFNPSCSVSGLTNLDERIPKDKTRTIMAVEIVSAHNFFIHSLLSKVF